MATIEIPDGLQQLLQDFTVAVLRSRPSSLIAFAADYFQQLWQEAGSPTMTATAGNGASERQAPSSAKVMFPQSVDSDNENNEGDNRDDDLLDTEPKSRAAGGAGGRRVSVAAPSFDPEKHDGDSDQQHQPHQQDAEERRKVVPKTDEQRRRLSEAVKHILLFRSLDRVSLGHVIDAMHEAPVSAGDVVIEQHQDGDNFYVIERGVFDAYVMDSATRERRHVLTYTHEGSFGELALMYYCPRAATVVARTEGVLWSLDMETFQRKVLMAAFRNRQKYEAFLASVPLLGEMTQYERQNVADALKERQFADGEPILHQGDVGNDMFFIEEGGVKVMRRNSDNGLETQVNQLGKGEYFGELALITKQPRAASCYAVGRTCVCVLHVSDFERLLGPCLDVMRRNIDAYKSQLAGIFGHEANIPLPRLPEAE